MQTDFSALASVCVGGLAMGFIAVVLGWNMAYALRGLLKHFGMIRDQPPS